MPRSERCTRPGAGDGFNRRAGKRISPAWMLPAVQRAVIKGHWRGAFTTVSSGFPGAIVDLAAPEPGRFCCCPANRPCRSCGTRSSILPIRVISPRPGIPRPLERSERADGGPLNYRVRSSAKLWAKGESPKLKLDVLEGDPKLSI
jgi:hypothetical protein